MSEKEVGELSISYSADDGAVRELLAQVTDLPGFEVYQQGNTSRYTITFDPTPPEVKQEAELTGGEEADE